MHSAVRTYYGSSLSGSQDLRTSACCDASSVPEELKPLLARIHPGLSAKTPKEYRIICFRLSCELLLANIQDFKYLETTIIRLMEHVSAILFMSWTWQRGMLPP